MIELGLTDHVEGPRETVSSKIYEQVIEQTILADRLGFDYAWFAEHHAHAHHGHLPAPLLLALHLAGRTKTIRLGTAIVCLNLHHPLAVAEQTAVADAFTGGRLAPGFGSGSTPEEVALFGGGVADDSRRHQRFAEALRLILSAWRGNVGEETGWPFGVPAHQPLPIASPDLASRAWLAVNSDGAARIAGELGFNMLFSHLRTPEQYRQYLATYHRHGGGGRVAANRPVHVAETDAAAFERAEPALRILWRRFQAEGKIPASDVEPSDPRHLCAHPLNFIVGGAQRVAEQLLELHAASPYDVANLEVNWQGVSRDAIADCMRRLAHDVKPLLGFTASNTF